jgi:hypothetical protein
VAGDAFWHEVSVHSLGGAPRWRQGQSNRITFCP